LARRCLHEAIDTVRTDWPFLLTAIVLLPDHLRTVWTLPPGDARYPIRWKRIKEEFTRRYLKMDAEDPTSGYDDPEWGE
jgi:putative transposase